MFYWIIHFHPKISADFAPAEIYYSYCIFFLTIGNAPVRLAVSTFHQELHTKHINAAANRFLYFYFEL